MVCSAPVESDHVGSPVVPVYPIEDVNPHECLIMMLTHGAYYAGDLYRPELSRYRKAPHPSDLASYSKQFLAAVRLSNISILQLVSKKGIHLTACNKLCLSVVHLACRQASTEVSCI